MRRLNFAILIMIYASVATFVNAITLEAAKALYNSGKYAEALPAMLEQYKKNPKNASVNQWVGVCLYKTGRGAEAKKYFEFAATKNVLESNLYLGKISAEGYEYGEAAEYLNKYEAALAKAKKEVPEEVREYMNKIHSAKLMLDHVEKIVVIDSIVVDREGFFKAYNLSPDAGEFRPSVVLPHGGENGIETVFMPENGHRMLWASVSDTKGESRIMETQKLLDGSWDKYHAYSENLNESGDVQFPFMMPDGATLYYSCNGNSSIGGYDIYMTRKDSESGEFLQPQNVGMPYNSPYDDYLLVKDEQTGLGWWATDRNQIPGKLTIYVFKLNEMRENCDVDDEKLASLALVKCIRDTWVEGEDYSELIKIAQTPIEKEVVKASDFEFVVKKGVVYTNFDEFKSNEAHSLMEQYVAMQKTQNSEKIILKAKRNQYAKTDNKSELAADIQKLEKKILSQSEELETLANRIRKLEVRFLK